MQNRIPFVLASALKRKYAVRGHFYNVRLSSGLLVQCRSVLEIELRPQAHQDGGAKILLPDAVFVMMNPGSSEPLEGTIANITEDAFPITQKQLVPTKPDTTQYQVMRIMSFFGWEYVRVLNLSDLRNPNSSKFLGEVRLLESRNQFFAHTIFSDERTAELSSAMIRKGDAPIVCAWGVNTGLSPLINLAITAIQCGGRYVGLAKSESEHLFRHPLQRPQRAKQEWLDDMCSLLGKN